MNYGKQVAFVDAYGNTSLNFEKQDVSTHFIVTAVIIEENKTSPIRAQVETIRARHFQTGEMKSSGVADNSAKRIRVLADLAAVPFHFYSLVVDKRDILKTSGLIYKEPFIKFLHRQLLQKLFDSYQDISVVIDEYGRSEFMEGFKDYVAANFVIDLFRKPRLEFVSSKDEQLIQLADFVAGTLARFYDLSKVSTEGEQFLSLLKAHALVIDEWPPKYQSHIGATAGEDSTEFDRVIMQHCFSQATRFLSLNYDSRDESIVLQLETLKYLLYHFKFIDSNRPVSAWQIIDMLNETHNTTISQQAFYSNVIAKLRDKEVIISSSPKGYKIPSGLSDLLDYVEQTSGMVQPMLGRLAKVRNQILMVTKNGLDILQADKYKPLRDILG